MLAAAILAVMLACALQRAAGAQLPSPVAPGAGAGQPPSFPWAHTRLPGSVSPRHYHLRMQPNLTTMEFSGVVTIHLQVHEDTDHVVLHAHDMTISQALLWEAEPEPPPTTTTQTPPPRHAPLRVLEHRAFQQVALLVVPSSSERSSVPLLTAGRAYRLQISFHANLSTNFHGFYRSSYRTARGDLRFLASTQFEPTSARAAFPCFDEPAFKANFTIQIVREPRHIALSNMPKVKTVALPGGLLEDYFDTSVAMSTYLVAFIISDFLSVSKTTQHGAKISVYCVPEKIDQTAFALQAAVKLLDFYDEYFDIPYPLPKQDLAAIPDFQSGAMENWGLTTYREDGLLFDPGKSSASDKLSITMVIAHELAHQWFGNLVTMAWWNDLWLNEGFAKFMEFVSVSVVYPELHVEDFFLGKCLEAMEVDSLSSSHPVSAPTVESPAQIREMFDDVSYRKGACILNMLRDFLSADAFKVGIVAYLKRHAYRNTVSAHLWDSLSQICHQSHDHDEGPIRRHKFCSEGRLQPGSSKWYSGDELDVRAIMDTWTLQEGFPLVSVAVTGREVTLRQERYLKSDGPAPADGRFLWQIPLTYVTSSSPTVHRFLLKTESDVLYLPEEALWVKFNVDMAGYYMVHYEGEGWRSLTSLLHGNHTALSSGDRAQLVNNVFQLVSVGKVGLDTALDLSLYLSRETDIVVVTQGLMELVPLYKMMEKRDMPDLEDRMKGYIVELFRALIDLQEWTDSGSVPQRVLRAHLLLFACIRNHPPCLARATRLFRLWRESDGNHSIPSDVSLAVFSVGARTPEGWDFLLDQYRRSLQDSVKSRIKYALTISPQHHKLQWMLEQCLRGDVLKSHDLPGVLVSVSRNPRGYRLAWDFLRDNWNDIITKFDLGSSQVARMVTGVTDQYSTTHMLQEVRSFFGSLTEETGSQLRCIRQSYESIQENIRWTDSNLPVLQAWLQAHTPRDRAPHTPHDDL